MNIPKVNLISEIQMKSNDADEGIIIDNSFIEINRKIGID